MKKKLKKMPLFIPELKMTVWVDESKKVSDVRKKYIEDKDFRLNTVKAY